MPLALRVYVILDEVAPRWDERRVENRLLPASADAVYAVVLNADFRDFARFNRIVEALFVKLSRIPLHGDWVPLAADPPHEIAFGGSDIPGYVKIATNVRIEVSSDGGSRVTHEVRALATGPQSRRALLRYWRFVSPMLGFIMRATLARIARRVAEVCEHDHILDEFIPQYDIAERHKVHVAAPAQQAMATALRLDFQDSAVIRAIFKAREWILRSRPSDDRSPTGIVAQTKALGWGELATVPGREIVMGAITQPWLPNVEFHAIPPARFAAHNEPDHVKIAWTLRADPLNDHASVFRTETRVAACDAAARSRFRWYWRRFSPGILLIRRAILRRVKKEAERRARVSAGHEA